MKLIRPSSVIFVDDNLEKEFNCISDDDEMKKFLTRAIKDIEGNAFCGVQIPKKLIPVEYVKKFGIKNLWKYDLPDGWRLIYSITNPSKIEILSILLEWFDHKDYERKFNYG